MGRGTGGHHVVNQGDVGRQRRDAIDLEGAFEVLPTTGGRQLALRDRGASADEAPRQQRRGAPLGQMPGQLQRLVETALPQAARMQRYRNQRRRRTGWCLEVEQRGQQRGHRQAFVKLELLNEEIDRRPVAERRQYAVEGRWTTDARGARQPVR